MLQTHRVSEPSLVPQHGIGAQYLEPAPYVGAVGVPGVLPLSLPPLPVIVSPDQAQLQVSEHIGNTICHILFLLSIVFIVILLIMIISIFYYY